MNYKPLPVASLGARGEDAVCDQLLQEGFMIHARNFFWRGGEVDIIAQRGTLLLCVEVKTRTRAYFPTSTVVTKSKQRKLIQTIRYFTARHSITDVTIRFDVAVVIMQDEAPVVDYFPNAFNPAENDDYIG